MSLVHQLAEKASALTGAKFTVHREEYRYRIRVERNGFDMVFGDANVHETKSRLAMICDLVNMGFIAR